MQGELFALGSAALYALASAGIARGAAEGRPGDNGALLSVLVMAVAALVLWLATNGPSSLASLSRAEVAAATALNVAAGLFSMALGRISMFRSVAAGGMIRAGMLRRLTAVFAVAFSGLFLSTLPDPQALAGIALVLLGAASLGRGGRPTASRGRAWIAWGILCAASYGMAYVLRKLAMEPVPSPMYGALVGAVTGLGLYGAATAFSATARGAVSGMLRHTGRWQVLTAVTLAVAQIGQFVALSLADPAIVAAVGATDTLFAIALAVALRTETRPRATVAAGALLSTAGVAVIAFA